MTPLFSKTDPIQNSELAGYQPALQNTQGNILKSHGRDFTVNMFLTFTGDVANLKTAIRSLAVTSAWEQMNQTRAFKASGHESLFMGLGLSSEGYAYLGYTNPAAFPVAFWDGMESAVKRLGDPPISTWEPKFGRPLHAMILLAHAELRELQKQQDIVAGLFQNSASIITEQGQANYNGNGHVIEQFGFADGISQPLFLQSDIDPSGFVQWDPAAGPNLVLVRDPYGMSDNDCGSYFVFRKLEQDVARFKKAEAALQSKLAPGQDPELAAAMAVGRFRDGTPVARYPAPVDSGVPENDFIYTDPEADTGADPFARKCPVSAHIRKVNPRGDTRRPFGNTPATLANERIHRIARRGISYGTFGHSKTVGLLFQCCQSDLTNQFEFLQSAWAGVPAQPSADAGTDPIIGKRPCSGQTWIRQWGTPNMIAKEECPFGPFVTLKGFAYFFLPSLTFLNNI